ncbi:phosphoenolpyruvate--protein phosphotransferase [Acidisoma cellulosilytica]|uniref:Phosphoenolpyruvate-protein phosphotransferase n=1 Tax=Acidisoma cellulosilyticum TaxID=2802395 RepID=A0A963Z206_9PROT|nr:phosphoenolpyruvate--protein phosphotransferase [Acidisoma cellulosilyticum]MCB8881383.1 phosphoenolpyruvate--protein phosphotransferase [Acidisoma cellulosilyticum]
MYLEQRVVVNVPEGLHARPASQFVRLARGFEASIQIERQGKRADAKSSVRLMLLGVKERDEITLHADGDDATEALQCLSAFVSDTSPAAAPSALPPAADPSSPALTALGEYSGTPASDGIALGAAFHFFPADISAPALVSGGIDYAAELQRYEAAVQVTVDRLSAKRQRSDSEAEAIVQALIDVAADPAFHEEIAQHLQGGMDAVNATMRAGRDIAERFEVAADPYLRARAEDIRSVARNVALALQGQTEPLLADIPPGSVILADELGAWELSTIDLSHIAGLVFRAGTPLSHAAIIARSHGIPAVIGCNASVEALKAARRVGLDGKTGTVVLDPTDAVAAPLLAHLSRDLAEKAALAAYRLVAPKTKDGRPVLVAANIGGERDIGPALQAGAQGVGLFRTEFLFMEARHLPSEDDQEAVYRRVLQAFAPHHVVVRTLDIGGDKPVAGIEFPKEENPFLGWRGVRMCLDRPDVFKPQIRALLRAATQGSLKVMIPMIADIGELRAVQAIVRDCAAELAAEGKPHGKFDLGIMIETPAAAWMADELAQEAAFFSIGTNDLTQYIMAADRTNPKVASLNRADHPAVLRAIAHICAAAKTAGIPVAICGEAAANLDLTKTFIDLGLDELSMSPAAILRAKKHITEIGL